MLVVLMVSAMTIWGVEGALCVTVSSLTGEMFNWTNLSVWSSGLPSEQNCVTLEPSWNSSRLGVIRNYEQITVRHLSVVGYGNQIPGSVSTTAGSTTKPSFTSVPLPVELSVGIVPMSATLRVLDGAVLRITGDLVLLNGGTLVLGSNQTLPSQVLVIVDGNVTLTGVSSIVGLGAMQVGGHVNLGPGSFLGPGLSWYSRSGSGQPGRPVCPSCAGTLWFDNVDQGPILGTLKLILSQPLVFPNATSIFYQMQPAGLDSASGRVISTLEVTTELRFTESPRIVVFIGDQGISIRHHQARSSFNKTLELISAPKVVGDALLDVVFSYYLRLAPRDFRSCSSCVIFGLGSNGEQDPQGGFSSCPTSSYQTTVSGAATLGILLGCTPTVSVYSSGGSGDGGNTGAVSGSGSEAPPPPLGPICLVNSCRNGGICIPAAPGDATVSCNCTADFEGPQCDTSRSGSSSFPTWAVVVVVVVPCVVAGVAVAVVIHYLTKRGVLSFDESMKRYRARAEKLNMNPAAVHNEL